MKTIGILGGMSWESSALYYRVINEEVKKRLGKLHSAKIVLYSVNFEPIEQLQHKGNWEATANILSKAAVALEKAGADFLVIATNTMHKVAPQISAQTKLPLLHIADATANALLKDGKKRVALLGTAFTMKQAFYKERLETNFGLEVIIPNEKECTRIHEIIYNELCLGIIKDASRKEYLNIIEKLVRNGAEGIILGCTEIGLLVQQNHLATPLYDTAVLHAKEAVTLALKKE